MPNHVMNRLKFKDLTKEDKDFIIKTLTVPDPDGDGGLLFTFDKVIPEPVTKDECPVDCLVTPDSHVAEVERKTLV